jgi:hypothetical protein
MRPAHRAVALPQLVGRLAARALRVIELLLQLLDAPAQLAQVLLRRRRIGLRWRSRWRRLPACRVRAGRNDEREEQRERERSQACFALPWLATECMARAMASWSPR